MECTETDPANVILKLDKESGTHTDSAGLYMLQTRHHFATCLYISKVTELH
jgi:hypothetical protein